MSNLNPVVGPAFPDRVHELEALYREIHAYAVTRDQGHTPLAPRRPEPRSLEGNLLLLGQGLAKDTQRVTGYPYRQPMGLSRAGRRLDDFLEPLGYTIDHTDLNRTYAYSTDLVPWFPGRTDDGRHDVRPTDSDVATCWSWFEREVELLEPSVVVLLGFPAARAFLNQYAGKRVRRRSTLSELVGRPFDATIRARPVTAVVGYHPSAAWGSLQQSADSAFRGAQLIIRDTLRREHGAP